MSDINGWSVNWSRDVINIPNMGSPIISPIPGTVHGQIIVSSDGDEVNLFDLESKMEAPKTDVKLENAEINDIRAMLTLIFNHFNKNSASLHCYFLAGPKNFCFHYMHSLPMIRLSLLQDGSGTVAFSSSWDGDPKRYDAWETVPLVDPTITPKNSHSKARSIFLIPNVTSINVYDWGFEVLNDGSVQMVAVLGYAIEGKPEKAIGSKGWKIPLKKDIPQDKKIAYWTKK